MTPLVWPVSRVGPNENSLCGGDSRHLPTICPLGIVALVRPRTTNPTISLAGMVTPPPVCRLCDAGSS